ncbi:Uridine kinase [Clostridiaceae bacterium JG1575]|nr:Uridine kinase [Clostridiaceae bacterium JG1575]
MTYRDFLKEKGKGPMPMLVRVGEEYLELTQEMRSEAFEVISTDQSAGNRVYERTLCFLLVRALYSLDQKARVHIEHSISRGLFCELHGLEANEETLGQIKNKMHELVLKNHPIRPKCLSKREAMAVFGAQGQDEIVTLLAHAKVEEVKAYELAGLVGYFYGPLAAQTADVPLFDLVGFGSGFVLMYPSLSIPDRVPRFSPQEKLYEIFRETGEWDRILGVSTVGALNEVIDEGGGKRIMAVAEALHEKKVAEIADAIKKRGDVRVVLMAGPSSAGKTTSSKRLAVQLMVNGLRPFPIEMDNYFVDRDKTPLGPDGTFDFESLHAINLERFNEDIKRLMAGETVTPPIFDFQSGLSVPGREVITIPKDGIIILEGIHGLNPELLCAIPERNKFKIYISALTQLNMDDHNRISTTDVRKLRRIVRDHRKRGWKPEETLALFNKVMQGEKKNIFPYQEQADMMLNTTLVYELAVLKKHALPLLLDIPRTSPVRFEADRLITLLRFVRELPDEAVLSNSILREFIGGSFFD